MGAHFSLKMAKSSQIHIPREKVLLSISYDVTLVMVGLVLKFTGIT